MLEVVAGDCGAGVSWVVDGWRLVSGWCAGDGVVVEVVLCVGVVGVCLV